MSADRAAEILRTGGLLPQQAEKPEPWDEVVPLGARAALPSFPLETLPAYMAAMAEAVAVEIQVPPDLPAALALGILSTAAGGRAEVLVRGQWIEPLNLYLATAMPPGSGKSPAFRIMSAPVFKAEHDMRVAAREQIIEAEAERDDTIAEAQARMKAAPEGSAEYDQARKDARLAELADIPQLPRLTADDVNPEQAATIMSEQGGRLAVLSAEGTFFSVIAGRYSSGVPNLELVLKAHAGDRVQVDRRGRTELIEHPALTIATTVQPSVLRDLAAKPAMRERGLLARFLLSLPPDLVGHRNVTAPLVPIEILRDYSDAVTALIRDLNRWKEAPVRIRLSPRALKLHTEFRGHLEPQLAAGTGELEALRDWASKLPGATARIAALLHLGENPASGTETEVGQDSMERAIVQARYWSEHAMAAFGVMRSHPALEDARAVLDHIHARRVGSPFTRRDVHRAMQSRFASAEAIDQPLAILVDHGYTRRQKPPPRSGPGRSSGPVYEVHPGHLPMGR